MTCRKILLPLFFIAAIFVACNKTAIDDNDESAIDLKKGYIYFDVETATRGSLVEGSLLLDDFHVIGYQYNGQWRSYKAMALPNVFYDTNKNLINPQTVTYDGGLYEYTPMQPWTGRNYAFFGYYPTNNANIKLFDQVLSNNGITPKEGEPYITYTLPISNNPCDLVDVMTARVINANADNTPSVVMNMQHRLSAIDICAHNYYKHDESDVTIEITQLQIKLSNISNTSAKFYLQHDREDDEPSSIYPEGNEQAELSYVYVNNTSASTPAWVRKLVVVPPTTDENPLTLISSPSGENPTSIIIIPQTEFLHVDVNISYRKRYLDNGSWVYLHEGNNTQDLDFSGEFTTTFDSSLKEGNRYYVDIFFTSDAVSANIRASQSWDDLKVNHDFE